MATLIKKTPDIKDRILATKNIRIELKEAFPKTKFSIKSTCFSGGDDINVSWVDGPTTEQVNNIIMKYQEGNFDGMIDLYEYNKDRSFTDTYGGAKYIFSNRRYTAKFIRLAAKKLGINEDLINEYSDEIKTYHSSSILREKGILDIKECDLPVEIVTI